MDTLELDSKLYTKVSSLARDFGYTADYVGQLCRAKKVDAKLVGRSWYVTRDSLDAHKHQRPRSNSAKTKDAVKVAVAKSVEKQSASRFLKRAEATKVPISYEPDSGELLPALEKKHGAGRVITVNLADATSVKVSSESKAFTISPEKRENIRFSGKISIQDMSEEGVEEEAVEEVTVTEESVEEQPTSFLRRLSSQTTPKDTPKKKVRSTVKKPTPRLREVHVPIQVLDDSNCHSSRYLFLRLSGVATLLIAVFIANFFLQSHTTVVAGEATSRYHFSTNSLEAFVLNVEK